MLGRFLEVDPVEGGGCNDYDYSCGDAVNAFDLDGNWCWGGIGSTCTRYARDSLGRRVPVRHKAKEKVKNKHGISWSTQKWLLENLDQTGGQGTRVEYGGVVTEIRCSTSSGCAPSGKSVYVYAVVDFRTNKQGETVGLVTMYCKGYDPLCPGWINGPKIDTTS